MLAAIFKIEHGVGQTYNGPPTVGRQVGGRAGASGDERPEHEDKPGHDQDGGAGLDEGLAGVDLRGRAAAALDVDDADDDEDGAGDDKGMVLQLPEPLELVVDIGVAGEAAVDVSSVSSSW